MRNKNLVNYYKVLNISSEATEEELREAYLKLVKIYHPDRNKGHVLAEKKFQKINTAWEVLKDPLQRKNFNLKLKVQEEFKKKLKEASKKKPVYKEIDLEVPVKLSLEDLCQARKKSFSYLKPINGSKEKSVFEFHVPPGVREGTLLRFNKKGGSEGLEPYGDLYVKVKIRTHKLFKKKDKDFDILLEQPVSLVSAYQDKTLSSLSPYGFLKLEIEPPLRHEQLLKATGMGLIKNSKGEKGDLFIKILIDYPLNQEVSIKEKLKGLSLEEQKKYIESLAKKKWVYPELLKFEKKLQEIKLNHYK